MVDCRKQLQSKGTNDVSYKKKKELHLKRQKKNGKKEERLTE